MKNYHLFTEDIGHYCRECLNEEYGINLNNGDCGYFIYLQMCSRCREVKNIVIDVRFSRRIKLFMGLK